METLSVALWTTNLEPPAPACSCCRSSPAWLASIAGPALEGLQPLPVRYGVALLLGIDAGPQHDADADQRDGEESPFRAMMTIALTSSKMALALSRTSTIPAHRHRPAVQTLRMAEVE
jgi:hypothetical protein